VEIEDRLISISSHDLLVTKEQKHKEEQKQATEKDLETGILLQNVYIFLKHQHHTDPGNHLEKLLRKESNPYPEKTKQLLFYY